MSDQRVLTVVVAGSLDAEKLSRLRFLSIGRDHQLAAQRSAIAQADRDMGIGGDYASEPGLEQHGACAPRRLQTLPLQHAPVDDESEIRLADFRAFEAQGTLAVRLTPGLPDAHPLLAEHPFRGQRFP